MATLVGPPKFKVYLDSGAPAAGGKVYTYIPGTTTDKATYTDASQATPNTNPVILDARGEADIWWLGPYDIVVSDADDNNIDSFSDYTAQPSLATSSVLDPNGNELLTFVGGSSPVNYLTITNAAASGTPKISSADGVTFKAKGSGDVTFGSNIEITGDVTFNGDIVNASGVTICQFDSNASANTFLDLSSLNQLRASGSSTLTLSATLVAFPGNIQFDAAPTYSGDLYIKDTVRLYDADASNYITVTNPGSLAASRTITLPSSAPTTGDFVTVDGSNNWGYSSPSYSAATTSTAGIATLATTSEAEAGTVTDEFVAVGDLDGSPGNPKVYVYYDQDAPSITDSKGVTSVTDTSTGLFTVNYSVTFATDDFVVQAMCFYRIIGSDTLYAHKLSSMGTTSCTVDVSAASLDFNNNYVVVWGNLA